jgi:hypothetical protein
MGSSLNSHMGPPHSTPSSPRCFCGALANQRVARVPKCSLNNLSTVFTSFGLIQIEFDQSLGFLTCLAPHGLINHFGVIDHSLQKKMGFLDGFFIDGF